MRCLGCRVEAGAEVNYAILCDGAIVKRGARVGRGCGTCVRVITFSCYLITYYIFCRISVHKHIFVCGDLNNSIRFCNAVDHFLLSVGPLLTGAKNKNKKRLKFCVFVFCPSKSEENEKRASVFCFWTVFGGAKTKNAKFLAFFVFVFCSRKERSQ